MARRAVTIAVELSVDEDSLREDDLDAQSRFAAVATHVERAALGGVCPTLRPMASASVGREGLHYGPS